MVAAAFLVAGTALAACGKGGSAETRTDTTSPATSVDAPPTSNDVAVAHDASPPIDTAGGPDASASPANAPGKVVHKVTLGGLEREFIVYVPESAKGTKPVPVVFMFHGTSGDGEKFFNISGWTPKADAEGFISVYPSSLTYCFYEDEDHDGTFAKTERLVTTKWSAGTLGDPKSLPLCTADDLAALPADKRALVDHPIADDVAFVDSILDTLASKYSVNSKRIYASGFSNGGEMTARLLVERSNRFAMIGCAASLMNVPPAFGRAMNAIWSVGSEDPGYQAYFKATPLPLDASFGQNPTFKGEMGNFVTTLGLAAQAAWSEGALDGQKTSEFLFATSTVGASNSFRAVVISGATHQYPNGTNHPAKMAEYLWEQFKGQSLP